VEIKHDGMKERGRVEIKYSSRAELKQIRDKIVGAKVTWTWADKGGAE
jgi:hypothetical protein